MDESKIQAGDEDLCLITQARLAFHVSLLAELFRIDESGVASIADKDSPSSVAIAAGMVRRIGKETTGLRLAGQTSGRKLETLVQAFLEFTFPRLGILRCGTFEVLGGQSIANFEQYEHLSAIADVIKDSPELKIALGRNYLVKPDVIIARISEPDSAINRDAILVDLNTARLTSIRAANNDRPILHASISCKWTLRSDRAQNSRSEALNLIRNRKGRLPHAVVVTAEPMPSRIASLALGTGDIDCVYHVALGELRDTIVELGRDESLELLDMMIDGKRLRDISDLPLDLAI